jgi:subfamily B ATP-binding cassette protein MsbA
MMGDLRRLGSFLRPYWLHLAGGLGCALIVALAQLFVPRYLGNTIDAIIRTRNLQLLNLTAGVILAAFLVRSVFLYGQLYLIFYIGHRVIADLRNAIFSQIQRWSLDRFARWHSGELIARAIQDTQLIQTNLLSGLVDFVGVSLTLLGILLMIFWLQWQLALVTVLVIPLFFGTARLFGREIHKISARAQQRIADLTTLLREAVAGARIIRAFTQEARETTRFAAENERTFRENLRISKLVATEAPVVSLLTTIGLVLVLWKGGQYVTRGVMTAGELVAFLTYVGIAVEPVLHLTRLYSGMRQAAASVERIVEVLTTRETVLEAPDAFDLPPIQGHVAFRNVSFAYNGQQEVLTDITFEVRPGERVAIIGPSGAGKSTLINLIPRFYDPTRGVVEIDGYDLRRVKIQSLRRQIGIVPQEVVLFSGTIRENIAYGRPGATMEEVEAAARAANAHAFICGLPAGYDTVVGEGGLQLSGGERQRIAIARAILNNPRILILDEATSALDSESERLIQEALERLMEGRTTFIVAHRMSTVRHAHRILVLMDGRLVEEGSHEDLLRREGVYQRLSRMQLVD